LEKLKAEHSSINADDSNRSDEKSKKKKKKRKTEKKSGMTLAQNKVAAGHAAKMRSAKDLSTKSKEDLAAIFGTTEVDVMLTKSTATVKKSKRKRSKESSGGKKKKSKKEINKNMKLDAEETAATAVQA